MKSESTRLFAWDIRKLLAFSLVLAISIPVACVYVPAINSENNSPMIPDNSREPKDPFKVPDVKKIHFQGVSFNLNTSVAKSVSTRVVEEFKPQNPEFLPKTFDPRHISFVLQGAYAPDPNEQPEIKIYLVSEYKSAALTSGDYGLAVEDEFGRLSDLIRNRPESPTDAFLFIPWADAVQIFHSRFSYVRLADGGGISYLTQFNHADPELISNYKLMYVFQGLTNDHRYFITATIPVRASFLPSERDARSYKNYEQSRDFYEKEERRKNQEAYQSYLRDVEFDINAAPDSSFAPSIEILNNLFSSITIDPDTFSKKRR